MISKGRHPKSPIAKVLASLDSTRFVIDEIHKGHRWGVVTCIICGAKAPVWSTPRVPEHNAEAIRRFAGKHHH